MPQGTASLRLRPGCDIQQEGACKAPLPYLLSVGIEHKLLAVGQACIKYAVLFNLKRGRRMFLSTYSKGNHR
jgi:hypothetical protein